MLSRLLVLTLLTSIELLLLITTDTVVSANPYSESHIILDVYMLLGSTLWANNVIAPGYVGFWQFPALLDHLHSLASLILVESPRVCLKSDPYV